MVVQVLLPERPGRRLVKIEYNLSISERKRCRELPVFRNQYPLPV